MLGLIDHDLRLLDIDTPFWVRFLPDTVTHVIALPGWKPKKNHLVREVKSVFIVEPAPSFSLR